ncbi:dephospho-CoA kinase domain-containing protein-like, partial [Stylophora pistillata]|uniref:dephospho-CoA kinase domain-containing protein-like n=1 Tax=Stylophora pistillata TaxID=50429 RepID=UPI000C051B3C
LTGGIATGKSTVSRILKDLGCPVVDADLIAREVVEPHKPAWKAIVKNFGRDILLNNEEIDRVKLGKIVFEDDAKRRVLNKCTHPFIHRSILWSLLRNFLSGLTSRVLDLNLGRCF